MRRQTLVRATAVAASMAVVVILSVPPVRAVVFDAMDTTATPGQGAKRPTLPPSRTGHDPVIAAAGDIACASSSARSESCRQLYTSDLLARGGFDGVLDLGDNQYNAGALSAYRTYYDPTWGRVKAITHPVPGNHEYESANASGYYAYFGAAAGAPPRATTATTSESGTSSH